MQDAGLHFFKRCVDLLRDSVSTDPRDHIFGAVSYLMGPVSDTARILLKADYRSTVQEVFTRAATVFLTEMPDLVLLSECEALNQHQISGLPSWVPDFTTLFNSFLDLDIDHLFDVSRDQRGRSANTKHLVRVAGSRLYVRGKFLDSVSVIAAHQDNFKADLRSEASIVVQSVRTLQSWFDLVNATSSKYLRKAYKPLSALEVLCRALTFDGLAIVASVSHDKNLNLLFHDFLLGWIAKLSIFKAEGKVPDNLELDLHVIHQDSVCWPPRDLIQNFLRYQVIGSQPVAMQEAFMAHGFGDAYGLDEDFLARAGRITSNVRKFSEMLSIHSKYRRLFSTEHAYLGYGSVSMRKGDQVWLIDGARVPMVLRKAEGQNEFILVGECYLHGVMHGEKWGSRWRKPKLTEICLI